MDILTCDPQKGLKPVLFFFFPDRQSEPLLRLDAKDRGASTSDLASSDGDGGCPPHTSGCGTSGSSPMASQASGPTSSYFYLLMSIFTFAVNFEIVLRKNCAKSRDHEL